MYVIVVVFILETICDNLEMVKPMWSAAVAHSLDDVCHLKKIL